MTDRISKPTKIDTNSEAYYPMQKVKADKESLL